MKKLIRGIVNFRNSLTDERRKLFAKLALGQKPDALFIACSDSRVVPNLFASTDPGDLFVLRNLGNLLPPPESMCDTGVMAGIEYAVLSLQVSNIIICGHSECGAMMAIAEGVNQSLYPYLASWLRYGQECLNKVRSGFVLDASLLEHNQLSQVNVLQQMQHISNYPFVRRAIEMNLLKVHGWWFDIANADVYNFEESLNRFMLIDENEANIILDKLY